MSDIAIIGGGLFGATTAFVLARDGHRVTLFEKGHDLLRAASGTNQYRLHAGYHYPRSAETGRQSRGGLVSFRSEFADAIVDSGSQYYAVARSESRTSADQFAAFCEAERLPTFRCDNVDIISPEHVEAVFAVQESRFDVTRLREVVRWKLRRHSVRVFLGTKADTNRLADFDWVIVAGYANNNAILDGMGVKPIIKQYEVCEKPVVQMPSRLRHKSIVVIDGPFMCMDPIGVGSQHIWGHVTYGVHATTEGYRPDIPASLRAFVNRGIVTSVPNTSFERFRTDGGRFVPDFLDSRHVGSMFTLKVVPFDVDATDERPTDVMCVGKNVIVISSGKLSTAVSTAGQIRELLADKDQQSRRGNREPKYGAL